MADGHCSKAGGESGSLAARPAVPLISELPCPPPCATTEQAGGKRGRQRHPSHPCDCAPAGGCHPHLRVAGQDEPAGRRGQATWYHTRRWYRWLGAGRGCGFAPLDGPLSAVSIPMQTTATEAHVRQALELFKTSTMDAVKSGLMEVAVFTDEQR